MPAVACGLLGLLFMVLVGPMLWAGASQLTAEKLVSDSFANRWASSLFSMQVVVDTWGLGAGLGSNRPASFPFMLISCVGLIGATLFAYAIVKMIRAAWGQPESRPVAWALLAFFLTKAVAGANMSEPLMWLCLGICAQVTWHRNRSVAALAHR
jgi:hypothetical protein